MLACALLVAVGCAPERDPPEEAAWGRSSPEAQGMDSALLAALLDSVRVTKLEVHSLLVVRHGKIVLETNVFPYDGSRPHDVASVTKSLTSTAVGVAVTRGDFGGVGDELLGYFPERVVENDSDAKREMTLAHALTMRAGLACDSSPGEPTLQQMLGAPSYVDFVLGLPMAAPPGSTFEYCSPVSHLLSAAVSEATGEPLDAYLWRHVLEPLGLDTPIWPRDAEQISHGWGDARLYPTDLARVGLFLSGGGEHRGREVIAREYVDQATENQTGASGPADGFGYHFWVSPGVGYYAAGRGGQFLFVAPELDLVVVTAGSVGASRVEELAALLAEYLLPAVKSESPLPENGSALTELRQLESTLRGPPASTPPTDLPALAPTVSGRAFALGSNPLGWEELAVTFTPASAKLEVAIGAERSTFDIGLDGVPRITRNTRFTQLYRHADTDVAMSGRWLDGHGFLIELDTIDRIDAGTLLLDFSPKSVGVTLEERTFMGGSIQFGGVAH